MLMFRYFILLSLILAISAKTLNYKKIIYAIDCGNTQAYKSQTGVQYYPDRGYSDNTKVADYSTNSEIASAIIKYTYDQSVYMTERHAEDTFYYDIPVNNPGKYVLISKFAENWHRTPKTRVFHIKIGDCMGEANVDIYDKVGRFAAYDSYIEFELKNNLIFVNGRPCDGAYVNGKLRVYYVKIGMDNPKVDGIMLFQGELAETDFDELPAMRRDWERRMKDEARRKEEDRLRKEEARLKRREKIKPRNDDFEGSGEDFEDMDYGNTRGGNIIDTLSDYLVLLIVIAVGAAIIYYVSAKGDAGSSWIDSIFGVDERPLLREERKEKKEKAPKVASAAKAESATKTTPAAEGGQTKVESKKKKN